MNLLSSLDVTSVTLERRWSTPETRVYLAPGLRTFGDPSGRPAWMISCGVVLQWVKQLHPGLSRIHGPPVIHDAVLNLVLLKKVNNANV